MRTRCGWKPCRPPDRAGCRDPSGRAAARSVRASGWAARAGPEDPILGREPAPIPRLVAVADEERIDRPDFPARLDSLLAAGCPAVWLRGGRRRARELLALARLVARRCHAVGAELWVGDRADVAALARADAVHLPERGLSIAGARRAAPGLAVGRSVHSVEAALAAARAGADWLVVGTIFPSGSHPLSDAAGPGLLVDVRAALAAEGRELPLVAIGGLTPERVREARRAGADGVAAIRALWDAEDPGKAARAFLAALRHPAD